MAHIGKSTFQYCDSLEGICLSEFVTTGEGAFEDCTSLTSIRFGCVCGSNWYIYKL